MGFSMKSMLRTIHLGVGICMLTLTSFGLCAFARLFFGHKTAKLWHEAILGRGTYYWMRLIGAWQLTVRGQIPPPDQTFVIVANHASFCDHAILSFLPIHKKYLTKSRYFTLPFFGWTQWLVSDIGVDVVSKESRSKSVEACIQAVKAGNSIVIYPEGTRVLEPTMIGEFKEGAFRIAQECKVKVLPVCLHDTHVALGKGFKAGIAHMVLSIGEPFEVEEVTSAVQKARDWMQADLKDPIKGAATRSQGVTNKKPKKE